MDTNASAPFQVVQRTSVLGGARRVLLAGILVAMSHPANGQPPPSELSELFAHLQSLDSVHLSATSSIWAPVLSQCVDTQQNLSAPLDGQFEYWATGDKYYLKSWAEPDKYPGIQTEVAYDGEKFQLLRSDGTLSVSSTDSDTLLPVLPNPLWELVRFRYPVTDQNAGAELKFNAIKQDDVPESFWEVDWHSVPEFGQPLERAVFPGGSFEGKSYVHHVYAPEDEHHKPVRIDRVRPDGLLLTRTEFSNYQQVSGAWWPYQIVLRAFDDAGKSVGYIAYTVTELEINPSIPSGVFTIPPASAARVWDDDAAAFVEP